MNDRVGAKQLGEAAARDWSWPQLPPPSYESNAERFLGGPRNDRGEKVGGTAVLMVNCEW